MEVLQQVIVMIITLGILVAFHEYGHFWVARKCGVKVLRFSVGFGTPLFTWRDKHDTEFVIAALPLGGYVKMLDEREDEVPEALKAVAFNNQSVQKRIAIVSAGPVANFLLAIFVYWLVFLNGTAGLVPTLFDVEQDTVAYQAGLREGMTLTAVDGEPVETVRDAAMQLLHRVGDSGVVVIQAVDGKSTSEQAYSLKIESWLSGEEGSVDTLGSLGLGFYRGVILPKAAQIAPDTPAAQVGLQAGDIFLAVDDIAIKNGREFVEYVMQRPGIPLTLKVQRGSDILEVVVTPATFVLEDGRKVGRVGVVMEQEAVPDALITRKTYSFFGAVQPAVYETWKATSYTLMSLKKMLLGDISYKQLSGPITIAKVASKSADSGIYSYLSLLALLSVSLGVLNLLPIPVLDGGHIFFYLVEWIKGKPVPEKVQILAYQVGLAVVLSVMVLAVFNDIGRL